MQEKERARKRTGKRKKAEWNWNGDHSRLREEENTGNKDISERPVPSEHHKCCFTQLSLSLSDVANLASAELTAGLEVFQ